MCRSDVLDTVVLHASTFLGLEETTAFIAGTVTGNIPFLNALTWGRTLTVLLGRMGLGSRFELTGDKAPT